MNWRRFEKRGIDPKDKFFNRLWMVSRALGEISPFSEEVLNLNNVQLNFILHKFAEDHPNEYKISDAEIAEGRNPSQVYTDWSNKLTGKTREEFDRNPILFLKRYYNWSIN